MEIKLPQKIYKIEKDEKGREKLVYSCQYHIVFCTKYRRPILSEQEIIDRLTELIYEDQEKLEYQVIDIEIKTDYVHLILDLNPRIGVYNVVAHIKRLTSSKLRREFPDLKKKIPATWTNSCFISSIGLMDMNKILCYVESQKNK